MQAGDSYVDKVFTQRLNLWKLDDTVRRYVTDPALGRMLCELSGVSGIRVWHDQALIKEPAGNATTWHFDNPKWSFTSRDAITVWIALDDATMANGCLWFIPGRHKVARYENVTPAAGVSMDANFKAYPEFMNVDPVCAQFPAGSCSFHNGLTAHAAGPNMTRGRRRAMTCAYMPEGSVFNGQKNVLPDEYVQRLKVGDVLDNEDENPLVYSLGAGAPARQRPTVAF